MTLNEQLELTGSEVSINELPAGASVPFVHVHKRNEELYIILVHCLRGDTFLANQEDVRNGCQKVSAIIAR